MSKRVPMSIDEMAGAKNALNNALQRAAMLMHQKSAFEAVVGLKIQIEIDPVHNYPRLKYKAAIRVPMEMSETGMAAEISAIEWDEARQEYIMELAGEQMKIE